MNINDIFNQMDYGSATNLMDEARGWIEAHGGMLGPYVLGKWRLEQLPDASNQKQKNWATEIVYEVNREEGEDVKLCSIKYGENVSELIKEVITASAADDATPTLDRAALQRFGDILAKKSNLAAGLECLSTGRCVGQIINFKLPRAVQRLKHVTNSSFDTPNESREVVVIGVPSDASLSDVIQLVGPSLMTGNRVILSIYKDVSTGKENLVNLALFYLADVAAEANLPIGSLNIMYDVAPMKYSGQLNSRQIFLDSEQEMHIAGNGFSLISIAKLYFVFVVFDSSDLSAAVEGAVRAIVDYTQEKTTLKIYIQESVFEVFMSLLRLALGKLRIGKCTDLSSDIPDNYFGIVDSIVRVQNVGYVEIERLSIETFRTAKEVANLINGRGQRQLRLSLWTELIVVALELSDEIMADTIWVNCYREEDPAIEGGKLQDIMRFHQSIKSPVNQRVFISEFEHFQPSEAVIKCVETVVKAQLNWQKISQAERALKLERLAEPKQNWNDLKELVVDSEIDSLIRVLKTSSRYADKISGRIKCSTSFRGKVLITTEPLGAVVIVPSEEFPLLSFSLAAIPLLVAGNSLLIVSSTSRAKLFTNLIKILALPAGVIATLESNDAVSHPQQTIKSLCHTNIRSIFYFGANDADDVNLSLPPPSSNLKRIQFDTGAHFNEQKLKPSSPDNAMLDETLVGQRKSVWLPSGVTFAT